MTALNERPNLRVRIAIALAVGFAAGLATYWHFVVFSPGLVAHDFTWAWRGAQALLAGKNPYVEIQPTGPFPFNAAFKYPLPDAVIALPLALLPPFVAVAMFGAFGAAVLAFALTRDGFWRLPVLASAPFFSTLITGQWSLLTTAAALLPAAGWLACLKPTTGLASFVYHPWRVSLIGGAIAYALCMLLVPTWPVEWLRAMLFDPSTHWYVPAIRVLAGPLLLLALLRWRTPEGRMLAVLAIVPQMQLFYSGLVALLVARTFRESLILAVTSCLGYLGWASLGWIFDGRPLLDPASHQAEWMMLSIYLPALALVLRRSNEGRAPPWLERLVAPLPRAIRGKPGLSGETT